MPQFEKHNKGMKTLIDTSEALLNAMEVNGIDPETVSNRPNTKKKNEKRNKTNKTKQQQENT